ncbi:dipeptidase [Streptomyces sp. H27-C3]|uniref:dipeptidase n=1 Tax=Streptomyces sp. H27-C3 TaxID=3046305 RepID=UPI0024B8A503|nr:dipeptidase [Streptomyces sp. H27-C3]MDJ0460370.1 dipeptidase [Streptomyces sp. H27-C3]
MADLQDDPHTDSATSSSSVGQLDPEARSGAPAHAEPSTECTPVYAEPSDECTAAYAEPLAESAPVYTEPAAVPAPEVRPAEQHARALLAEHPVADGCNGLAWKLRALTWHDLELGESTLDTDIPRLRAGGVGAQFWSLQVPVDYTGDRAVSVTLEQIDLVRSLVAAYPESLRLAQDAGSMADARNCGRIASLLGPVSGHALGESLGTLRAYHTLGVRSVAFAGTRWTQEGKGLTRFGQEVVREMNRLGMLIDLVGASDLTTQRVLTVARAPVLFSRSGALALVDHPANVPDDVLSLLAPDKGVCMVSFAPEQVGSTVGELVNHLDHVREVAGRECVGLGAMYGTEAPHIEGLPDTSCYPKVVTELLDRGWDDADIALLTWGNVARTMQNAEFTARAARRRRGPSTATAQELDGL